LWFFIAQHHAGQLNGWFGMALVASLLAFHGRLVVLKNNTPCLGLKKSERGILKLKCVLLCDCYQ